MSKPCAALALLAVIAAAATPATADEPPAVELGSYGRVSLGTDGHGATPEAVSGVAHAPRGVERSYRLLDPYQHQLVSVADPVLGADEIVQLDRQRGVLAARASYRFFGPAAGGLAAKATLYLEVQAIGAGTRVRPDESREPLPSDQGL